MAISLCLALIFNSGPAYLIAPALAASVSTALPAQGHTSVIGRAIRPYPMPTPFPGSAPPGTKRNLELELSEGMEEAEKGPPPNKVVIAAALPVERLKELLKRLPPPEAQETSPDFNIPAGVTPPPRPGKIVNLQFPPKETPTAPVPVKPQVKVGPLTVVRKSPTGSLSNVREISVTFSQPMVPITDAESETLASNLPVHLTPQPAGKWRWLGTQTLVFKPDGNRLPRSTVYKVEIPKGVKSIIGGTLATAVDWTISTPTAQLQSFTPDTSNDPAQPQHLDKMMIAIFDQAVDPQKVLEHIKVGEGKNPLGLRLATEQELKDDKNGVASLIKSQPKGTCVAFRASKLFSKKQEIAVTIGPGIPSKEGPLVGKDQWNYSFRTFWPLDIARTNNANSPSDAMSIEFNNPIDQKLFKPAMLSVKPSIDGMQVNWYGNTIAISGELKPRQKYEITLDKGITDVFGQSLGETKKQTLSVGEAYPNLHIPNEAMIILQPSKSPAFNFMSTNIQQFKVNIYGVSPTDYRTYLKSVNEYRQWHEHAEQYKDLQGLKTLSSKVINLQKSDEANTETSIDLSPYMKNGLGNVVVTVERWPRKKNEIQRFPVWVQGTRIGLDVFSDGFTLVSHASKLEDGSPIANAQISTDGKTSISGKTDKDGVARIPMSNVQPAIVYCKSGDDQCFLPNNQYWWVQESTISHHKDMLRWYTVTDRNLYRPGEKVQVKGWVRRFGYGPKGEISKLQNVSPELNYSINDGNGVQITKGSEKIDANGAYTFSFDIPKTANLGYAYISTNTGEDAYANSNSTQFRIEEFRRPEFEMSVKSSKGSMTLGESTNLTASASYYSGGPLGDAPVHWTVRSSQTTFAPPGWPEYNFGRHNQYFSFYEDYGRSSSIYYGGATDPEYTFDGKSNGAGKHILQLKSKSLAEPYPVSIVAEGTVTDVNRQEWSDKSTILLHPAQVYVGLKASKQFYKSDEPIKLESIVTDLDGKAVSEQPVHIEVTKEKGVWKDEGYTTEHQKLASTDIKSGAAPLEWLPDFKEGGNIKISAVVTDASGHKNKSELSFWRAEKQPPDQKKVEMGKLLMVADRKTYQPGDTAEIMIQAPFAGGRGVATIRHNGISSTIPVSLNESSGSIKVPITEELLPNATVQIDLVGENCTYASGNVALSVPAESRRINVEVKPALTALSPGSSTAINFTLKDPSGKPAANAQVAVAVVDESVLALSGYNWQDPISAFYMPTSPSTNDYHGRQYVILGKKKQQPKLEAQMNKMRTRATSLAAPKSALAPSPMAMRRGGGGGSGGGGGGLAYAASAEGAADASMVMDKRAPGALMLQGATNGTIGPQDADGIAMDEAGKAASTPITVRKDFNALAYFNPALTTDENGNAKCEVKFPDSLTRYRVMVAAVSGDKFFGKGESTITARLPLMVRPSAPRFLNFGDKCEVPVVLQNQTDREMSVDLGIRAVNLKFALKDDKSAADGIDLTHNSGGNVLVPPNDRVEVRFPASTEVDGTATLDIAVASNENADAANVSFPVYTPATSHAFATYGQIDEGGVEQVLEMPKDVFPQIGGLELSSSSTALQSLTDAYIYIHDYSFLCSEQLSSRILSTAALQDVLVAFNKMTPKEIEETKAQIQGDIKELCKRQENDGSFGLWKRGEQYRWPFVSIQVARALHEAKARKYEVSDVAYTQVRQYLHNIESHLPTREYDEYTRRSFSAYALFVRHLMNDSDPGKARRLIQTALGSYDSKREGTRRSRHLPAKGASQQDKLVDVLSLESIAWLLPVLSNDKNSQSEVALLRSALSSHVKETASKAEIDDDSNGEFDYLIFYSGSRLNATFLECMIMDQPKSDLIPKLASALLAHRKAGRWESTQENCTAILALNRYFNTYEKQVPDFVANTWLGKQYVGQNKFVGRSTDTQVINVPMRFLEAHQADKEILISKTGKGRLYYRLALNYAPKNLLLGAFDNGFSVKRSYEAVDNKDDVKKDADGVWHFKAGATVKAKLEIQSTGRRYHVALTDPLPAGMEPVNSTLEGTRSFHDEHLPQPEAPGVDEEDSSGDEGGRSVFWYPWWGMNWYEHQNLRDFRAEAFTSLLYAGKYNYTYTMRATTPGDYVVPPAKVEEMYTPETFGRAASEHVIVE